MAVCGFRLPIFQMLVEENSGDRGNAIEVMGNLISRNAQFQFVKRLEKLQHITVDSIHFHIYNLLFYFRKTNGWVYGHEKQHFYICYEISFSD